MGSWNSVYQSGVKVSVFTPCEQLYIYKKYIYIYIYIVNICIYKINKIYVFIICIHYYVYIYRNNWALL